MALRDSLPLWMLFPVFFVLVYLSHFTLLRLPYYWDEAGYYIPAAYDFFRTGSLIPITTLSNAHPPLPSILLATWWRLSGFVPSGTRTAMCIVSSAALLGVYRLASTMVRAEVAAAVTLLTGLYSVWFAQSTLAHADMFAAAFTLWALSFYFDRSGPLSGAPQAGSSRHNRGWAFLCFSLAALCKETAIITPFALALFEGIQLIRERGTNSLLREHMRWLLALLLPVLPLVCWYAYHWRHTGFIFGNPEYLRYNATANLSVPHVAIALLHRLMHLFFHMNMFVPVLCTLAAMLLAPLAEREGALRGQPRPRIPLPLQAAIGAVLLANLLFFSVMGGALLTRYLLVLYPLLLLECVSTWRRRVPHWWLLVVFSAVAFVAGIFINPPYRFAPEDNLNYRDMIVLHQQAIQQIAKQWPEATVLTTWPASDELAKSELGYAHSPIRVVSLDNFSLPELEKGAAEADRYDTALVFSTRFGPAAWTPPMLGLNPAHLPRWMDSFSTADGPGSRFDFQSTLSAREVAQLLHGSIVWQRERNGLWIAILRFPRSVNAKLE